MKCGYTSVYRTARDSRCPYLPNITTLQRTHAGRSVFRECNGMPQVDCSKRFSSLDQIATAKGMARSEWMRDVILRELRGDSANDPSLAEILGVRLLLVNVLRPLAAGQRLTPEAFDKLLDEISEAKHALAGKLAASAGRK